VDFKTDYAYGWLAMHWYGSCLAQERFSKDEALVPMLAAQNFQNAFLSHFRYTFLDYASRHMTPDEDVPYARDDACVYRYREVAPSFLHGFVWHYALKGRAAGAPDLATAMAGVCDQRVLLEDWLIECRHAIGHAAVYWTLADLGIIDDAEMNAPLAGAFATSGRGAEVLQQAEALVLDFLKTSGFKFLGGKDGTFLGGVTHNVLVDFDYNSTDDEAFWAAFLLTKRQDVWPTRIAPVGGPCDYDDHNNLGDPQVSFPRVGERTRWTEAMAREKT